MVTKSTLPFNVSSGFSPFAKRGSGWFAVWITAVLLLLLCPNHQSWSAEISVIASLQPATTNVGEPVQLHVTINGSQRVAEIPSVRIDGAQVQYIGQATQMRLVNTELSVSLTHRYLVSPGRIGELEVPPVEVTVDGRKYQTEPLKLKVLEAGQEPGATPQAMPFAEIQLPRSFAYVGEAVPVEVRLGVPSDTRWRIERMPEFETDAFTKTTFQQPQQRQENRQGRDFDVCSFRTVMTAIKSGKVPIGPLTFNIQMAVPKKRNNAANPLGAILDGFPFDNQPAAFQQRSIVLAEQRVDIRELPTEGKPASFRGAVGRFHFNATPNQAKIKAGEPITMTLQIEGEGNFDRIEVPPMLQADGWRVYPAEVSFVKGEESGFRGTKTFRIAMVPEQAQTETPKFEFACFDPETGKYQLQTSVANPLQIEGGKRPEPEKAAEPKPAAPPPAPKPEHKPIEKPVLSEDFSLPKPEAPFWRSPLWFWGLQGALALSLLSGATALYVRSVRAKQGPGRALQQLARKLQEELAHQTNKAPFLQQAVRIAQLHAAARAGQPDAAIDAEDVIRALSLSKAQADEIRWLFEADAAARFSGALSNSPIKESERIRVQETLKFLA